MADLVHSAFGHAGQKCSAASLGIMVGSTYDSQRYRSQLIDAASSMVVDWPANLSATMGPLTEDPSDKLRRALTSLEPGESWLLEPKQLDDTGRLWSPGIKDGVKPGSFFHLTEVFGPVLGLMHAKDLDEAIEFQNAVDFGLTGGIHSLDPAEVATWLDRVQRGAAGRRRSPAIKAGVKPGASFPLAEVFGPVPGLMHAKDLDEAIEFQNAVDVGLTGGIHSLAPAEVATWLDRVEVGNAYVNR